MNLPEPLRMFQRALMIATVIAFASAHAVAIYKVSTAQPAAVTDVALAVTGD